MEIGQIVLGHVNEVLGFNKDLKEERLKICKMCPLYSNILGGICNNKIWMNPRTNEISTEAKDGYVKGCGCRMNAKASLPNAKCIINKW